MSDYEDQSYPIWLAAPAIFRLSNLDAASSLDLFSIEKVNTIKKCRTKSWIMKWSLTLLGNKTFNIATVDEY